MSNRKSLENKLKKLEKETKPKKRYQSVVYMNEDGSIDWPDNPNPSGVMVVPKKVSEEEWEKKAVEYSKLHSDDLF